MRKILALIVLLIFAVNLASATVKIEKDEGWPVVIADTGVPAKTVLHITNLGTSDTFEIYNLIGISLAPKGSFSIGAGQKIDLPVEIYLTPEILEKNRGYFVFEYEIQGAHSGITKDKIQVKIVDLESVLEVQPVKILPGDTEAQITVKNLENANFEDITLHAKSAFFDGEKTFDLEANGHANITYGVNQEKIKKFSAGAFPGTFSFKLLKAKAILSQNILYLEKSGLSVVESTEGIIARTKTITKTNEGNIQTTAEISDTRSIFTKLFTTQYPLPELVKKQGFYTKYTWSKDVAPGESFAVKITTNYTIPLIIAIIIVAIILGVKLSMSRVVEAHKTVTFVKTKGGEFALKVTLRVKTSKHIDNVQITDRIPGSMKLFAPSLKQGTFDSSTNRVKLTIPQLNQGEERVISYIVYSKMNIVGKFELPSALVLYELNGKTQDVNSNIAYFMGDTMNREE